MHCTAQHSIITCSNIAKHRDWKRRRQTEGKASNMLPLRRHVQVNNTAVKAMMQFCLQASSTKAGDTVLHIIPCFFPTKHQQPAA